MRPRVRAYAVEALKSAMVLVCSVRGNVPHAAVEASRSRHWLYEASSCDVLSCDVVCCDVEYPSVTLIRYRYERL